MLKPRLRQHPGEYVHHCGGGQLATYEVQPEEPHGSHIEDDRAQSLPKRPERVVWTNVQRFIRAQVLTLRRGRRTSAGRDPEPVSP